MPDREYRANRFDRLSTRPDCGRTLGRGTVSSTSHHVASVGTVCGSVEAHEVFSRVCAACSGRDVSESGSTRAWRDEQGSRYDADGVDDLEELANAAFEGSTRAVARDALRFRSRRETPRVQPCKRVRASFRPIRRAGTGRFQENARERGHTAVRHSPEPLRGTRSGRRLWRTSRRENRLASGTSTTMSRKRERTAAPRASRSPTSRRARGATNRRFRNRALRSARGPVAPRRDV